jgi:hypothetical protein
MRSASTALELIGNLERAGEFEHPTPTFDKVALLSLPARQSGRTDVHTAFGRMRHSALILAGPATA